MTDNQKKNQDKLDTASNSMWGGRFQSGPDKIMEAINSSINFDQRLYLQDIEASKSHCMMLVKSKILDTKTGNKIIAGLERILIEIETGVFNFRSSMEDIHLNIESRLHELIGDNAGCLHTARSRNDQVATDFRLWIRDATDRADTYLTDLQAVLLEQADLHYDWIMPGFTHLQAAQPITLGHHLHAYVEMFGRDKGRFSDARKRLNECPLGAAALAGTSFPIDRYETARALGFEKPTANSLDSVSARDFALEFMSASSICAMHLSRLAEEIVLWCSAQFSFACLSDSFTTGSSIMPQKRNPDAAELIRSKTGRINGDLISLLTVLKGLPLAYSKDMQEDKEPTFDSWDSLSLCLNAMTGMIKDLRFNRNTMQVAAGSGFSTATDLADWLVRELKMPFRKAHHITGEIVRLAEKRGCNLADLNLTELKKLENGITKGIFDVLSVSNSVSSRTSYGGTSPENVRAQISLAKESIIK